ncbi:MAG: DUF4383 domain-containing protein [Actinomycetota bacterium]
MSLAQMFARIFGAVYVLVGVVGFLPFVGGTFNQDPNNLLGIFGVTLVHNIVHLAVGAAFLVASTSDALARPVNIAIGVVYTLVGVVGVLNIAFVNSLLAINLPDNLLHFATGILALVFGFIGKGAATTPPAGGGGGGYLTGDQLPRYGR